MSKHKIEAFDVAIVGGGPAGLSAAITLGRCRRRVLLFDHGKPRNYAAQGVHCFLGLEGLSPTEIRELGRIEATAYGVTFFDAEVTSVKCLSESGSKRTAFKIQTAQHNFDVRAVLFATGVVDVLPDIEGLKELYGLSVHHCPYCDGWEHRDQRLVALGKGHSAVDLGATLRRWSDDVTVCTNGETISDEGLEVLQRNGIPFRAAKISSLNAEDGVLHDILFEDGSELPCDAIFFSSDQGQRSDLPVTIGCECDDEGLIVTDKKHATNVKGIYLAGDADGDVQFAIAAAAEGAIAATAINSALQTEDME